VCVCVSSLSLSLLLRDSDHLTRHRKTFGYFKSITAGQFADEIDNEVESGAFVIIHLHQKVRPSNRESP
jgi:hypothetical protein